MKNFRYLIFISILSGIFFVIYRQSDEKGLRKLWSSFKIAVLIARIAIPNNVEAIEPHVSNKSPSIERTLTLKSRV